jgi:hypothetical protein
VRSGSCESAPIAYQLVESMGFVQSEGGVKTVVNGSVMVGNGLNELDALAGAKDFDGRLGSLGTEYGYEVAKALEEEGNKYELEELYGTNKNDELDEGTKYDELDEGIKNEELDDGENLAASAMTDSYSHQAIRT